MIKFFRNIRQKMLTENKFSKYLIYAIGEIVLVVIGILIALQINNWNELNKIKQEEKILIAGLIQNIDKDIKNLMITKKSDSIFIVANKIVLSAFKNDSVRNNKSFLSSSIIKSSFTNSFNPTQTVFNQMQFSGKLNYILSDTIKNKIQSYYDSVKDVIDTQEVNLNFIHDLNQRLTTFGDINSVFQSILPEFAKMELDELDNSFYSEPLQSDKVKEFANLVTSKQVVMLPILNSYKSLLQNGIQLKQELTEYLDEK